MILGLLFKLLVFSSSTLIPYYFFWNTTLTQAPSQALAVPDAAPLQGIQRSGNAVWLEHKWLQEGVSEADMIALCRRLNEAHIRYVYPHLAPVDSEGRLPPFSEETARLFRRVLHKHAPQVLILPWIGGIRAGYQQARAGTVFLDVDRYLQTFAGECVYLTDHLGFDGIHLNIEPVESGDTRFLEWLAYVKTRIGRGKILSVAASKPSYVDAFNLSPVRSWDLAYFQAVARLADQLVIMNYDTGLRHPSWYSLFTRQKLIGLLSRLDAAGSHCKVLLGVPTYQDAPAHLRSAENMSTALSGIRSALANREVAKENFEGIAIYGYWTTTEADWKQFSRDWLKQ